MKSLHGMRRWGFAVVLVLAMMVAVFSSSAGSSVFGVTAWASEKYVVSGVSNYLALRTEMAYDSRNEIGKLNNGDTVDVIDTGNGTYWYVYSGRLGKYGYVNGKYLVRSGSQSNAAPSDYSYSWDISGSVYTVTGTTHYLALRTSPAYDNRNEIGKLYNGQEVTVQNTGDGTYWYVYAGSLGQYGYVNASYLTPGRVAVQGNPGNPVGSYYSYSSYVVSGTKHYLAVRTEMAYDGSNEIGKLYNGDTVQMINTGDGTYWYIYSPKLNIYGYTSTAII